MPDNIYKMNVARLADEEILDALRNYDKYVDDMLIELINECERRKLPLQGVDRLRTMVEERLAKVEVVNDLFETQEIKPEEPLPVLFSQSTIFAFSIFFSPLSGGILLAINVAKSKKSGAWLVAFISLAISILVGVLSYYFVPPGSIFAVLLLGAAAFIISQLLWNRFIGKFVNYEKRSFVIPLIIMLIIIIPIAYYAYLHPELFQLPTTPTTSK